MDKIRLDGEHKNRIKLIISSLINRIENSKSNSEYKGHAFSTFEFTNVDELTEKFNGIWLEPRMQLQLASNFYQPLIVDGQKIRSDWSSGWLRVVIFKNDSLILLAHGNVRKDKEYNLFLYSVEFKKGEYTLTKEDNKFQVKVENVEKTGIDLISGNPAAYKFSFSFIHNPTDTTFVPRDRIESSGLFKSVYHGKVAPKPITFDWSNYVITVPHFAFHSILHQRWKEFGFNSAIEMQHYVTEVLKMMIK